MFTTKNIETRDVPRRRMEGAAAAPANWRESLGSYIDTLNDLVSPDISRVEQVFTREQKISPYIGLGRVYKAHLANIQDIQPDPVMLESVATGPQIAMSEVSLERNPDWVNPAFEYPLGPPRMEGVLTSQSLAHPQGHHAWSFAAETNDNLKGVSMDQSYNDREFTLYSRTGNDALLRAMTQQAAVEFVREDTRALKGATA